MVPKALLLGFASQQHVGPPDSARSESFLVESEQSTSSNSLMSQSAPVQKLLGREPWVTPQSPILRCGRNLTARRANPVLSVPPLSSAQTGQRGWQPQDGPWPTDRWARPDCHRIPHPYLATLLLSGTGAFFSSGAQHWPKEYLRCALHNMTSQDLRLISPLPSASSFRKRSSACCCQVFWAFPREL